MKKYTLRCVECGEEIIKDEYTTRCKRGHSALLRTEYRRKKLEVKDSPGIWKFSNWLPVMRESSCDASPITYKSEGLAKELGLSNLYISFNGYWPERGAYIKTCSFKELEAMPTLQRVCERARDRMLVVCSAGNTARGFVYISSILNIPIIAVVPRDYMDRMWAVEEIKGVVLIAVVGDYTDAIKVGEKISGLEGMLGEGGVRNVARRDGLGMVLLDALLSMKELPRHYFQAVGSGVGAIGVFEMAKRVIEDGRFGKELPRLHLAQNLPFAPMYNAWKAKRREIIAEHDMQDADNAIKRMYANVLSTKNPAYSIKGGVYDILNEAGGTIYGITNEEAKEAEKLFESIEGIDLDPAASVGIAALIKAVEQDAVGKDDKILLNVSGGGYKRIKEDYSLCKMKPDFSVSLDTPIEEIEKELRECIKAVTLSR
ncbi:MAG: cysteate synthase [Candidatus Methanospirareceae archaeon]